MTLSGMLCGHLSAKNHWHRRDLQILNAGNRETHAKVGHSSVHNTTFPSTDFTLNLTMSINDKITSDSVHVCTHVNDYLLHSE